MSEQGQVALLWRRNGTPRRVNPGQEPSQRENQEPGPQGKDALIAGGGKRNVDEWESAERNTGGHDIGDEDQSQEGGQNLESIDHPEVGQRQGQMKAAHLQGGIVQKGACHHREIPGQKEDDGNHSRGEVQGQKEDHQEENILGQEVDHLEADPSQTGSHHEKGQGNH